MRVLLIAEQANPEWVSVPLIGWSLCEALSHLVSAHVVTHVRNRDAFVRAGWVEGRDFTALDTENVARPLYKISSVLRGGDGKGWTTVTAFSSLAYYAFEAALWRRFGAQIKNHEFDVVHRVTPLSPTSPSTLAKKCHRAGVPFVLGPLNGGLPWPAGFESRRQAEREWLSYLRNLYKLLPGISAAQKYAALILVGSQATRQQIPAKYQNKVVYMAENGIDPVRFSKRRTKAATLPLVATFVGRLVPYKCPDVMITAASSLLKAGKLKLQIIGDGPMRPDLERLIATEGLGESVELKGWLQHEQVQDLLVQSDLLLLPSIREFGGGVVLEAMACGVPPVIADYGGPAELLVDGGGYKIQFTDEPSLRRNLEAMLVRLVDDPASIDACASLAPKIIASKYSWQRKASAIVEIYKERLGKTPSSQSVPMPATAP